MLELPLLNRPRVNACKVKGPKYGPNLGHANYMSNV